MPFWQHDARLLKQRDSNLQFAHWSAFLSALHFDSTAKKSMLQRSPLVCLLVRHIDETSHPRNLTALKFKEELNRTR